MSPRGPKGRPRLRFGVPRARRGEGRRERAAASAPPNGASADGTSTPGQEAVEPRPRPVPSSVPRIFLHRPGQGLECTMHPSDLRAVVRDPGDARLWVDIDTSSRHQVALLEKVFDMHPLAVEDCLNPQSRVKIDEYKSGLFVIVRGLRFCDDTDDPYDVETFNLACWLSRTLLVTTHYGPTEVIDEVAARVQANPELLDRGVERLMHEMLDQAVDAYFPVLERLDDFLDGIEERIYQRFDQDSLADVFAVKRLVLAMRRHLAPQRDVFNALSSRPTPWLTPETQLYYRDVYDHVLRINDGIDMYRELLSNVMDSYLSQVSNRLGQVTKGLSVIATLSVPFVVVSGMWGMNFERIPLSHSPYGFWIMLALQLGLGAGLVWLLRRWELL
jgi:magnesium transporter